MTHGNDKGQGVKNITEADVLSQMAKLEQQVKYCQEKIKWYQEELDRRKQEVPLGVPAERKAYKEAYFVNCTGGVIDQPLDPNDKYDKEIFDMLDVFTSEASAKKHAEMLLAWRKALVANAKGNPIDIQVLLPLLKKGWVAMDKNGSWYAYKDKPIHDTAEWLSTKPTAYLGGFNLKPAENWETSLMECGL